MEKATRGDGVCKGNVMMGDVWIGDEWIGRVDKRRCDPCHIRVCDRCITSSPYGY